MTSFGLCDSEDARETKYDTRSVFLTNEIDLVVMSMSLSQSKLELLRSEIKRLPTTTRVQTWTAEGPH